LLFGVDMIKKKWPSVLLILILVIAAMPPFAAAAEKSPAFDVIKIDEPITPPIAEYIIKSIQQSAESGSEGIIIQLDTPGGLDLAMRDIIKEMLNSSVPVIVYVSPSGARAASAGALISIAATVAAMAPGTNIGAAHPVSLGFGKADDTMMEKVENDAVAYARGIAAKKGKNADWVEKAIRKSDSITAEDALKLHVIDLIAADMGQLLEKLDGMEVQVSSGKKVIHAKGATVNEKKIGFREKVLITISNPNIAYLLFLLGLAGLYFEFAHPGVILPGVVGGISLILAFFALQTLPVNYAGVLLIIFAVILFIAEILVISHGILTVGGIISLILGSIFLFDTPDPALRVSWSVLIPTIAVVSLFFVTVITLVLRAQMRKPATGEQGMLGEEGEAVTAISEEGKVMIKGEYWNATSRDPVEKGKRIKVVSIKGLMLEVVEKKTEEE
jgi:membrane-bound serine protease (ClpP class)